MLLFEIFEENGNIEENSILQEIHLVTSKKNKFIFKKPIETKTKNEESK